MNIHFKIDNSIMMIMTQDIGLQIPVFFIKCSFESNSPCSLNSEDMLKRSKEERSNFLEKIMTGKMSVEEQEMAEISPEQRRKLFDSHQKLSNAKGGARPAVAVGKGICVMIDSDISDCLGAGALVTNSEGYLYMERCTVRKCGYSGVEVRENGNLLLKDCNIHENYVGILSWECPLKVLILGCSVYNNTNEGIHGSDINMSYDNPTRLIIENN